MLLARQGTPAWKNKLLAGATLFALRASVANAQVYNGTGPSGGIAIVGGVAVPATDLRTVVIRILETALSFLTIVSVAAVIIAGIYLIVGLGSDDSKEKAKKIVQFTLIGLLIILFSRVIVGLVTVYLYSQV